MKLYNLNPLSKQLSELGVVSSPLASIGEIAGHAFSPPISSDESPSIEKTTHTIHPKAAYSRSNLYELYRKNDDHCKAPRLILSILCKNTYITKYRIFIILKDYGSKSSITKEEKLKHCLKGIRKKIKPYGYSIKKTEDGFKLKMNNSFYN